MTARPATDPDLWWHLRTGQWIVESGQVPHADPFSFTRLDHPWVAQEWLTEVTYYELWKHGGMAALIIFSAILTTAGFMLLYLRCPGKRAWAAAAIALGAWAAAPSFGVRPQMFTFTLASLLLWLLERSEDRQRLLFWIPPIFLLWLNLHAGFALGIALLAAYAAGLLLETALGETSWRDSRPVVLRIVLLTLVCLALVPLNPSGLHLYRYPLDTLHSPGMRGFIAEWFSPDFHVWLYRPLLLVWLLLLTFAGCSWTRPKGRILVPLLMTAFAGLDAVRHIPIFVLLAIPVLAGAQPNLSLWPVNPARHPLLLKIRPLFHAIVIALIATFTGAKWLSLATSQSARVAEHFPSNAITFLQGTSEPQRVFVYYDWGGYTIWALYPHSRVFIDGRADLYGDNLLHQFETALQLRTGWQEVLDHWKIDAVLIPPSAALAQGLAVDPAWEIRFHDPQAVYLVHSQLDRENPLLASPVTGRRR